MSMMNSTVRKSYRNETARSQELKAAKAAKYSASVAKKAALVAAYKAGYELGKSGLSFSDARFKHERALKINMTSKEHDAFVNGHWAGEHGEESEF